MTLTGFCDSVFSQTPFISLLGTRLAIHGLLAFHYTGRLIGDSWQCTGVAASAEGEWYTTRYEPPMSFRLTTGRHKSRSNTISGLRRQQHVYEYLL